MLETLIRPGVDRVKPIRDKSQSSDVTKDILLVSRDGVLFPSNSSILARRSPMIRNLLGDCPVEETSIINDIESTILHCGLGDFPNRTVCSGRGVKTRSEKIEQAKKEKNPI